MTALVFSVFILLSLIVAYVAKSGHNVEKLDEYLVAGRSFGGFILFFLAVGEIYSIGTMIGFPGGIYAKGISYGIWFLGYILLAYPVGYFLNPLIWRAGKKYGALTVPDLFRGHFSSRILELIVAITGVVFLIPWGQLQFTGLVVALNSLGWHLPASIMVLVAGLLAFLYIIASGVRAPAFVSIIKDTVMILAIIIAGVAAASSHSTARIFSAAAQHTHMTMTGGEEVFAMTTIVFQALGFYLFPFATQYIFTAKSETTIKRTQTVMPLYMLMYPFLVVAAYYALAQNLHLSSPNQAFMAAAVALLPNWVLGIVAAGAALSGLLVLAGISLTIGSMVSRNLTNRLNESTQRRWTQVVIVLYLLISIVLTLFTPTLMLTLINTAYYGVTQFLPGVLGILFSRRVTPTGVGAGILVGDVLAVLLYLTHTDIGHLNIGLISLVVNFIVTYGLSYLSRSHRQYVPIAHVNDPA